MVPTSLIFALTFVLSAQATFIAYTYKGDKCEGAPVLASAVDSSRCIAAGGQSSIYKSSGKLVKGYLFDNTDCSGAPKRTTEFPLDTCQNFNTYSAKLVISSYFDPEPTSNDDANMLYGADQCKGSIVATNIQYGTGCKYTAPCSKGQGSSSVSVCGNKAIFPGTK